MNPEEHKFWMVYGIGQGAPTVRHWSKDAARKEAQRLAECNPGVTFIVLAAVDGYTAERPTVTRVAITRDMIPF